MSGLIRVLIVEDDPSLATQLRWLLKGEHEVDVASSRKDAMDFLRNREFHVMLLDLGLPPRPEGPEEGLSLLRDAVREDPLLKVIIITAHGDQEVARQALSIGGYDFLVKPIEEELLTTLIKRAFYRRELEAKFWDTRQFELPVPMVVESPSMKEVIDTVRAVAPLNVTCLILGETGTGKELIAKLIHNFSARKNRAFVVLDCTSIPVTLGEAELFGAEKGSYTGATARREGRIRQAEGGTLFLDEVGELSYEVQSKLLRFIDTREYTPIGGRPVEANVRIVTATNRNLSEEIRRGRFRLDLYHRLSQVEIRIPPLRERKEEIIPLARYLLKQLGHEFRMKVPDLKEEAKEALLKYSFPGNVRELKNILSRAIIISRGGEIDGQILDIALLGSRGIGLNGREFSIVPGFDLPRARNLLEREWISAAIDRNKGKVSGAASDLGIPRTTLYDLIRKHKIEFTPSANGET